MAKNTTTYKELVDKFYNKIKDYDLASLDSAIANEIVVGYIAPACNQFQSCKQPLDDRDDELQQFNFKLSPSNVEILVNYMVIEWIDSNYINTTSALKSRLTSSDYHALNLHSMLSKVLEVRNSLKTEIDQLAINKSYIGSVMFDHVSKRRRF